MPLRRILGVTIAVGVFVACAPESSEATSESEIATRPPRTWDPTPVKPNNLRIATYNIRNFPRDTLGAPDAAAAGPKEEDARETERSSLDTDLDMALRVLERLDFDVLAVQEINDTAAFEDLLARLGDRNGRTYEAVFSTEWPHPQHTGIVVRGDRLRVESPKIHAEIATRPTLRAGLSARIVSTKAGGADFGMLVVHLAAGDSASRAELRAAQAEFAAKVVAERKSELGDDDFLVLGDFNSAREDEEMAGLDTALAADGSGLERPKDHPACTTYYTKSKSNPVLEPSWVDHVYLSSFAERDEDVPIASGAHCAERLCQRFESAGPESGTSYWGVSDHCPVYFEIADEDRD